VVEHPADGPRRDLRCCDDGHRQARHKRPVSRASAPDAAQPANADARYDHEREALERVLMCTLRAVEDERGLARVLDRLLCVHCAAFSHRCMLSVAEMDVRCGYAMPAALRALPTRMLCHIVTKTVLRSAAGT
jgi:hypothetical protein